MTLAPQYSPEKTELKIGFLPLTDCAVLVAAQERGLFEKYGLQVSLEREVSWANIRDRVAFGSLDAAHMLAPMPLAASLGIDGLGIPMQSAFSMGLNGSAITLSCELLKEMRAVAPDSFLESPLKADALKALLRADPSRKLVFAHVFPFSQHHYLLHAWLEDAGIDPVNDVEFKVIPPPQMVAQLASGQIDGYSAGEPWNQVAVQQGVGCIAISSYEIWNNGPGKVLGVTEWWATEHPQTHQALIAALLEAAQWSDQANSRYELAEWLSRPEYLNMPVEYISGPLLGECQYAGDEPVRNLPDFNCFYRYGATVPWHSHGAFFLQQMRHTGQLKEQVASSNILDKVYQLDLYRGVAEALGLPYPMDNVKQEVINQSPWVLQKASQSIAMGSSNITLQQLRDQLIALNKA
ncbi:CmpA/NrtA family ABC transporter substrate-binding protein [Leucothrix mucor]|uniref:CmpA/NrtA family ABC transporter substrate-binding protein n=1 Tax=Leucothrix mucor TaxID=45248 RepID=UPI0003B302E5|nr:CmpA/NrtA family ABC transporter substrate-binding protein [Leucothrix mucor]